MLGHHGNLLRLQGQWTDLESWRIHHAEYPLAATCLPSMLVFPRWHLCCALCHKPFQTKFYSHYREELWEVGMMCVKHPALHSSELSRLLLQHTANGSCSQYHHYHHHHHIDWSKNLDPTVLDQESPVFWERLFLDL